MKITSLVVKPHDFDQPITDNAFRLMLRNLIQKALSLTLLI
jgi:hypothetical protein